MDEVKQHVESALAALESRLSEAADAGLQLIKDKLVDIRDFLNRTYTEVTTPPADTPTDETSTPDTSSDATTEEPDASTNDVADTTVDPPVTDANDQPVTDPDAAR